MGFHIFFMTFYMIYEVSFKLCQFFHKDAMVPINNSNQSHVRLHIRQKDSFLAL